MFSIPSVYFSFLKSDARHHIAKLTRQSSKHFAEILTFNLANAFLHCPPSRSYRTVQRLLVASNPIDLSKSDCCERTAAIVNRTTGLVPAFRPVYSQWKMGMGLTALSGVNQRQFKCGCPAVLRNSHLRIPDSQFASRPDLRWMLPYHLHTSYSAISALRASYATFVLNPGAGFCRFFIWDHFFYRAIRLHHRPEFPNCLYAFRQHRCSWW